MEHKQEIQLEYCTVKLVKENEDKYYYLLFDTRKKSFEKDEYPPPPLKLYRSAMVKLYNKLPRAQELAREVFAKKHESHVNSKMETQYQDTNDDFQHPQEDEENEPGFLIVARLNTYNNMHVDMYIDDKINKPCVIVRLFYLNDEGNLSKSQYLAIFSLDDDAEALKKFILDVSPPMTSIKYRFDEKFKETYSKTSPLATGPSPKKPRSNPNDFFNI